MNIYPSIEVRLINDPLRDDIEYVTTYIYLVHLKYINESTNTTCTAGTKMWDYKLNTIKYIDTYLMGPAMSRCMNWINYWNGIHTKPKIKNEMSK